MRSRRCLLGTSPVAGWATALAGVSALAALAGCGDADGRVVVRFEPPVGAVFEYRTDVDATTTADLPCEDSPARSDHATIESHHEVLSSDADGVRVEVELSREGVGTRTFVVRFDRAAQLTAVEQVEGVPAEALGELGLSELFPAAAGAPPDRPLAPGDTWAIDDEVRIEGGAATRLVGEGRLRELGVVDGHDTATIVSTTRLGVRTTTPASSGTRSLDGEQRSDVEAVYDLDTGALRRATTATVGDYRVVLGPPPGGAGDPCAGTLRIVVRSTATRAES
jgi:hypothetical protein